jgi:hypothetical protein
MICPKCGAEYRPGFTQCADCEVDLVAAPPRGGQALAAFLSDKDPSRKRPRSGDPGDPKEDPFCSFWTGSDDRIRTELCTVLDEAGIPHKTIYRQDHLFNFNNQSRYEVGVPASLYENAELAIKEAFGTDVETEDAVPLLPAPDRNPADFEKGLREAIQDANEWLGSRYPEDATVEVWSGDNIDLIEMIEMSLRESDLLVRTEKTRGLARIYVLPEEEARAKEIVREIVEGQPSE